MGKKRFLKNKKTKNIFSGKRAPLFAPERTG
jgi:hypothetical protein